MGLFDIFRRHKKQPAAPAKSAEQSPADSPAGTEEPEIEPAAKSEAPVGAEPEAGEDQPVQKGAATQEPVAPEKPAEEAPLVESEEPAANPAESEAAESAVAAEPEEGGPVKVTAPAQPKSTEPGKAVKSTAPVGSASPATSAVPNVRSAEAKEAKSPETEKLTAEEPTATSADQAVGTAVAGGSEESGDAEAAGDQASAKYDRGLEKSRTGFGARLNRFLANFRSVDEDFFEDLEDLLIESDVGYEMAMKLTDALREEVKLQNARSKQDVSNVIIEKMVELYDAAGAGEATGLHFAATGPTVFMFVGVNGAGKTTTIGKLAARFKAEGRRVLLAAADTFRAGATEQLAVWAKRDGVDIVTGPVNGDPAAVVFDAVTKAKQEDYDVLLVDTAGRLQNKVNLMNELAKMKRILTREIPDAPHEVLLVLDATTGQNALNQAKLFKEATAVTGIVLTKLDGTARGGIVLAIQEELHLPVKFVGLGEQVGDLETFNAEDFVYGLFRGLVVVN